MSRCLLLMLILIIFRIDSHLMISFSAAYQIEDCFYEKRIDTSLDGHNYQNDPWISEIDCLDRCLKSKPDRCRSFEHWHSNRYGLCVRANVTLTDQPSTRRTNTYVNYYEINCRKDVKAVRPEIITCPGDQLNISVSLNGIDPNYVLLGDSKCKPIWSNETHVQFLTHVDNCSLNLTDGSIVGKLLWEGVVKDTNQAKQYERFFLCPSDIYRIRLAYWTTSSTTSTNIITAPNSLSTLPSGGDLTRRHPSLSTSSNRESPISGVMQKISLQWTIRNRTYHCPALCTISLSSFVRVTIDEINWSHSRSVIDWCEFRALHPYRTYFQNRRLIYRGCSLDSSIIHLSSDPQSYSFTFHLYNVLKEPIPFEILCALFTSPIGSDNCSSVTLMEHDPYWIRKEDQINYSTLLIHSAPVETTRQSPTHLTESTKTSNSNSLIWMITVHQFECFVFIVIFHWNAIFNRYT